MVDVDLFGVMRLFKEFVNSIFVSLFNVKLDQVGLDECSNVSKEQLLILILFDQTTERTEF